MARLQRLLTLFSLALAWGGFWLLRPASLFWAIAFWAAVTLAPALVLGLELLAMGWVNRADPTPPASAWQMLRAWVWESGLAWWVFGWRQPFRADRPPDLLDAAPEGLRGVLFVHGYVCNRGFWVDWMRICRRQGRPCMALTLEPPFNPIDAYGAQLDDAVATLTRQTGRLPVVVAHSMGGLVVRAWWRNTRFTDGVHHVVTLGSPHQGTWLGRFAQTANGRQMRLASPWLQALAATEPPDRARRFTCFYSNCDNIVFPASTARLEGADNRLVEGVPHVALAFDAAVRRQVLALIEAMD